MNDEPALVPYEHPTKPATVCDVCGRYVFVAWFSPWGGDGRLKCGSCSTPRRAEVQRTFPDHDAGDEDRTERDSVGAES